MFLFGSDKISCGIEFHVKGAATKKNSRKHSLLMRAIPMSTGENVWEDY